MKTSTSTGGGDCSLPDVAMCLNAGAMGRQDAESETLIPTNRCGFDVAHSLRAEGFDASEDGTGRGTPLVPVAYRTSGNCGAWETGDKTDALTTSTDPNSHVVAIQAGALRENPSSGPDGVGVQEGIAYTLEARAEVQAVAFAQNQRDEIRTMDVAGALAAEPGMKQQTYVQDAWAVRRLTPVECARLQGFPDEYLDITYRGKLAADGNKYKALGNSWAVPVGAWILNRAARAIHETEQR